MTGIRTFDALQSAALWRDDFDSAAARSPPPRFCSMSAWQLAAHEAFDAGRRAAAWTADGHWATFAQRRFDDDLGSLLLEPLESMWGFGRPLAGPDPDVSVALLSAIVCELDEKTAPVRMIRVSGLTEDDPLFVRLMTRRPRGFLPRVIAGIHTDLADLSGGSERYLSRRSPAFRANLRRLVRNAVKAGIQFEFIANATPPAECFQRILDVERRSWKGQANSGFTHWFGGEAFYRRLIERLSERGGFRAAFARLDDVDVGHAFGGVLAGEYRGMQIAYDERFARFGLGHLLQWELIQRLADEAVHTYDMGMTMEYKRRFRDEVRESREVILVR